MITPPHPTMFLLNSSAALRVNGDRDAKLSPTSPVWTTGTYYYKRAGAEILRQRWDEVGTGTSFQVRLPLGSAPPHNHHDQQNKQN
jgi:hypothetical protein